MTQIYVAFLMIGIGACGLLIGLNTGMPVTTSVGGGCVGYGLVTAIVVILKERLKR